MPLFETRGLTKYYSKRAVVDGVSIAVDRGEVVGILGPNGAGKTTAFRMCIGIVKPVAGKTFFDGKDITGVPMYKRSRMGMGYLAQDPSIFRHMSVQDNLLAIVEMLRMDRRERRRKTRALLEEFGLYGLREHMAYTLSGGERRRLEIARALCSDPQLMMLDEPFTGIDPIAVGELQDMVVGLKGRGIGVLITDHNVLEALRITDRAYILSEGKIVTQGTSVELLDDPIAREAYLGYRIQHAHIGREEPRANSTAPGPTDPGSAGG
ncbi:MAG: LPS export ABC transporter ATP-binding protein [Candidatus Brocadiia bacterium]|jgi:lipopolysaccharide export system ATP-binding protein|nr:LPS export ABC transporter ATP-binding protein [Candidatus Brocadiia bacterium]